MYIVIYIWAKFALQENKSRTSPTVELIRTIPTVVSVVTAALLRNTFVVLTRELSGFTSTFENRGNSEAWVWKPNCVHIKYVLRQSQRNLPQFCSSVRSPQSSTPSHFQNMGLHNPFLQVISFELHSVRRAWGRGWLGRVVQIQSWGTIWVKEYSLQLISSLMSPQSFQPSQRSSDLMQRWFLHWNCFGQAVTGRVNVRYNRLMSASSTIIVRGERGVTYGLSCQWPHTLQ